MKRLISITGCCLLLVCCAKSQESPRATGISLFTGMVNYQGDLNPNSFTFNHSHFAAGITIRKPLNRWFAARAGLMIGKIEAADRYNREYLQPRNLSFFNNVAELNLGLELSVLDISTNRISPYMYGGIAIFHTNPWTHDNNGNKVFLRPLSTEGQGLPQYPGQKPYDLYEMALMFGGGIRFAISDNINLGIEFSQRKSFTDYIDDVSTHFVDRDVLLQYRGQTAVDLAYRGDEVLGGNQNYPMHGEQRGTPTEMDWYYFLGTTIEVKLSAIGDLFRSIGSIHGSYDQRCPRKINY